MTGATTAATDISAKPPRAPRTRSSESGCHASSLERRCASYMSKSEDVFQQDGRHGRDEFGRVHQGRHGKIHHLNNESFQFKE